MKYLTKKEEADLVVLSQSGDVAARNMLITRNIPIIQKWVNGYLGGAECSDEEDLLHIGIMGYMRAIEKIDLSFGFRLNTYAKRAVCNIVNRYLRSDDHIIHTPMLCEPVLTDKFEYLNWLADESTVRDDDDIEMLPILLGKLTERERKIISWRYLRGWGLKRIAAKERVSKQRISQLIREILLKIRSHYEDRTLSR